MLCEVEDLRKRMCKLESYIVRTHTSDKNAKDEIGKKRKDLHVFATVDSDESIQPNVGDVYSVKDVKKVVSEPGNFWDGIYCLKAHKDWCNTGDVGGTNYANDVHF